MLGGASWNRMLHLPELPRGRPQTLFASAMHEAIGSSGAGKALNLARLGWETTLLAPLGADEPAESVRAGLAQSGVALLEVHDPGGTMQHVNLMAPGGDRISIVANPGTLALELDHRAYVERARGADLVAVSIFEYCRGFLAPFRDAGIEVWIDVHDYDGTNPHHADFVEAAGVLQVSTVALTGWRAFAEARLAAGTRAVVCTHGPLGASIATDAGWVEVEPEPVPALVDANGAGDAFFAGFATAWVNGADPAEAGRRGAICAAAALGSPELASREPPESWERIPRSRVGSSGEAMRRAPCERAAG